MGKLMNVIWLVCGIGLAGCEAAGTAAQSKTMQGAVTGGALGAGAGAIIGHQTGRAGEGAAIGAGLGAISGGLVGHALEEQRAKPSAVKTKVCPVGGELYTEDIKFCPHHGVELQRKD